MTSKITSALAILFFSPFTLMAQTSAFTEETSKEIVLPQAVQEHLDFKRNVRHTLVDKMTSKEIARSKANYSYVDPKNIIPKKLREAALAYFDVNKGNFANKNYITVVDFSAHSSRSRFFIIDMASGQVQALHVAHGKGSDKNNDGYAERFSNVSGSEASSIGYYRVSETYAGKYGTSIRLDGLSSTNSNARARAIVLHPAGYVSESGSRAGRSWGCFALDPKYAQSVFAKIKRGSLLYAHLSK